MLSVQFNRREYLFLLPKNMQRTCNGVWVWSLVRNQTVTLFQWFSWQLASKIINHLQSIPYPIAPACRSCSIKECNHKHSHENVAFVLIRICKKKKIHKADVLLLDRQSAKSVKCDLGLKPSLGKLDQSRFHDRLDCPKCHMVRKRHLNCKRPPG